MGHTAKLGWIDPACRNIIIGFFLLGPEWMSQIPPDTILLNTEQMLLDNPPTRWPSSILDWVRKFETWDYSERNIQKFQSDLIFGVKKLQIGFQEKLARIKSSENLDIDVLFYGAGNDRRWKIIFELRDAGLKVEKLFGVYGRERDEYIARSKVVLNLHYYKSQIFEIVRVFYLLTNSKAIVAEVNPTTSIDPIYHDGILGVPYENLTSACISLVKDKNLRIAMEKRAGECIRRWPQHRFLSEMLR